jgi:hypothetical protein
MGSKPLACETTGAIAAMSALESLPSTRKGQLRESAAIEECEKATANATLLVRLVRPESKVHARSFKKTPQRERCGL